MDQLGLQITSTKELQAAFDSILSDIGALIKSKEHEIREARAGKMHAEHLVIIQRDLAQDMCRATSEAEILSKALDSLLLVNGYDCGGAYLIQEDGWLRLMCHRNLNEDFIASASLYSPDTPQARLVALGKPIFRPYNSLGVGNIDEIRRAEGIKGIAIIPILDGPKVMGCINVASHVVDEADDPALDSLISIVGYVGEALAKARNAHQCHEARVQYEILAGAATDGIAILDGKQIIRCNRSLSTLLGYSESQLIGKSILEFIEPEDHAAYFHHEQKESEDQFQIHLMRSDSPSIAVLAELQHLHQRNGYDNCVVLVAHEWKQRV